MTVTRERTTEDAPRGGTLRSRIVGGFIALLALATLASVALVYTVSLARVNAAIDEQLRQEVQELRRLAGGNDPETGERFGRDVERIFTVFLQRNIPAENEVLLTFVDDEPFLRSRRQAPHRIDRDDDLMDHWAGVTDAERASVDTPSGEFEYLAVPVHSSAQRRGIFVVGFFADIERQEIYSPMWAAGSVGLATLLFGSLLAWRLAGRVVRPVEEVTTTAHGITETDLSRRIDVRSDDEIGRLALTFNEMLDRLEAAFRTQRQFIDDAGHELRTPITVIRGHLELLGDDPTERTETIALVTDELDRMARIVNDLLLLAKSEQPDFLELGVVDLETLTHELGAKLKALARRSWSVADVGRGKVIADRQRLTQAVMQLGDNAVQHTDEGAEIALGSSITNGIARIWLSDDGPGIPEEDQDAIFRRFRRASTRSRRSEGAGLGLAIVRAIAEAHKGRVELSSEPGRGATFSIVIPVDQPGKT